ncbi:MULTISPECIES: oligopeptide ABC transporter substrate-binding protein [unclassified Lactobacillus]|uniref:oligopeptide ABC transporter substrate-binding protein n=1 Tax=unclassified Lactobacillus TaxID=2620435 RepID=UPI000EFC7051|nr:MULTISPECIES: oligopeptide ABC transporter substrate-binding protein [unclassified Lactobacillus]RMC24525.1 oligopeptide ABC transporter substrate-binding protein [Lactobacillus sp. ESL0247]RMC28664.1 oligopeptide ABC transporter substrate-binding protein [Lactobacillus sp. ESL0246]RMC31856.1 oligopeptide ABC transporter substrate-binding protein [Lactobacillus sp. ESL0245]
MKKTKLLSSLGLVSTAALALVACGKNNTANTNEAKKASKFPQEMPVKDVKQGGTVKYAIEADSPFTGIFSNELETTAIDSNVMAPGNESLFDTDDNYRINDKGPASLKIDLKTKTVTINVKKGVKWSDGKQVTAKDIEYPYEIIANKATKSQRYSSKFEFIKGFKEYHEGKSKSISGIEMPDGENGRTVILHYTELKPGMYNSGNGYIWECAAPYHYLKDIPFSKLESSDKIRKNPMFFGPYQVQKVIRGQSVTWVPNKYYWRGKPKLDKIVAQVVSTNSTSQAIKSHKFDIADVINTQWKEIKDTKDVKFIAKVPLSYSYLGFKVGKWDAKTSKNVMNPKSKMNNKALRQAIGYAMNIEAVNKRYTSGLTFQIPTVIPEQFGDYFNKDVKGFSYNLKKANEILDKAGYKKEGKWRVQPNGKPLKIQLLAAQGDSSREPIIQNYIQQWHKIGLNVSLVGGRLAEANSFFDKIQNDDPAIDMYMAGWSLASEPSPANLYAEGSPLNYERFVTPENTKFLKEIDSEKSFDRKYRVQKFHEWQKYMFDQAYVIPTNNSYAITAVNSKLTGYSLKPSKGNSVWYDLGYAK